MNDNEQGKNLKIGAIAFLVIAAGAIMYWNVAQNYTKVRANQTPTHLISRNLGGLSMMASKYMNENNVTQVGFTELVNAGPEYRKNFRSIGDEDYTTITISKTMTQISISSTDFGIITYNL